MKQCLVFCFLGISGVLYSQENCKIDTAFTKMIAYVEIDPFWISDDDYILFVNVNHGQKIYKKFCFFDSTIMVLHNDKDDELMLQSISKVEHKFNELIIPSDVEFTIRNSTISKHIFDFVIISKQGKVMQIIPHSSTLDNSLGCLAELNNDLSLLLGEYYHLRLPKIKKGKKMVAAGTKSKRL